MALLYNARFGMYIFDDAFDAFSTFSKMFSMPSCYVLGLAIILACASFDYSTLFWRQKIEKRIFRRKIQIAVQQPCILQSISQDHSIELADNRTIQNILENSGKQNSPNAPNVTAKVAPSS